MPLPNYGYYNKEKKEHQELKFKMAPEIVDDPDYVPDKFSGMLNEIFENSRKETYNNKDDFNPFCYTSSHTKNTPVAELPPKSKSF